MFPLLLLILLHGGDAQISLPRLNIDVSAISVSGISSGACMATQFHVAYSRTIMGLGMVAGAPYYCAKGSTLTAINTCMNLPGTVDVASLQAQAAQYADAGDIDPTEYMTGDKIAILHGTSDTTVRIGASEKTEDFYSMYSDPGDVDANYDLDANHGFPTLDYGVPCSASRSPYINDCNYDGAFYLLDNIYTNVQKPPAGYEAQGTVEEFDQSEFFYISGPGSSSMDTVGYVYIPAACYTGQLCRLHVALHGCVMGRGVIDDEFAAYAGYNEVADYNNIVVLYPQAVRSMALPYNPNGCWDWWGYTINKYATKGANQPLAIARMIEQMSGADLTGDVDLSKHNV